jgi:peptidoglycan-associated lipoprotein
MRSVTTLAIIFLSLCFVFAGCAPKNPAPQTTETSAAGQQPAAGATAPATAAPGQEGAQAQAAPPAAQAAASFDKKIYFDYDKFDLSPESIQVLDNLVEFLKGNPELKVQVAGNCDERGTTEYNLALGDKRAKAAKDYCVAKGVEAKRLTTVSYGEEKPLDPGNTEEAWAKNRRDDFSFSK